MADKKSNLTSYDRKFIASLVFAHFGLVIMAISFFGLYYYEKVGTQNGKNIWIKQMKSVMLFLKDDIKRPRFSELRLAGAMEWDYSH